MTERRYWEVFLPRSVERKMLRHSLNQDDREVCGLLVGLFDDDYQKISVAEFRPVTNIAKDPQGLFVMEPSEQLAIFKDAHERKLQIVGCFHTHPFNFGIPSTIDASAINEDFAWLIWGGQDNTLRAWWPRDVKDTSAGFEAATLSYIPL